MKRFSAIPLVIDDVSRCSSKRTIFVCILVPVDYAQRCRLEGNVVAGCFSHCAGCSGHNTGNQASNDRAQAVETSERFADGIQTQRVEPPFWTWFVDNPRPPYAQ